MTRPGIVRPKGHLPGWRLSACLVWLLLCLPAATLATEQTVEGYHWPPGFFLHFGKLKQSQKEVMLTETEKKLASLRQAGKGLIVRGDLMDKVRTDVAEFNPATILDQSGLIVIVRNFPNVYFNFNGPENLVRRNTFLVVKNPQIDRSESILRQALVLRGDFFAFSQVYIKATVDNLRRALSAPPGALPQTEKPVPEKGKKKQER